MHPARHAPWTPVMLLLGACAQDPASLDGMMDELVRSAPEEPDTQLFEDSIRWHHEMFAYEALFRTLTP